MKPLKVCVLGGGTAGFMAAADLTRRFPDIELHHIYDSRIPAIGVGEGTTPPFRHWIHEVADLSFPELQRQCNVTRKDGIRFENWGQANEEYFHYFSRADGDHAYHISAEKIVGLLADCVDARSLDAKVVDVTSDGTQASLQLEDGREERYDLVIDARGFPRQLSAAHAPFPIIPTNTALLRRGPVSDFQTATRAVARPYGWIFVIPLTTHTSYGYVHNRSVSTQDEIATDLGMFFASEDIQAQEEFRFIQFPNFTCRSFFDGACFNIGNSASFFEPLEATAITVILFELKLIALWLAQRLTGTEQSSPRMLDRTLFDFVVEVGLFVGWHYAAGSRYDTPFWRHAKRGFEFGVNSADFNSVRSTFERFVEEGLRLPKDLALHGDSSKFHESASPEFMNSTFGGFHVESFAKVGHGMHYHP